MKRVGAESTVTECLGTDEWMKLRGRGRPLRIKLRDLYMDNMQQFFEHTSPKLVYNRMRVPLYYIIYACHFYVGKKIWEDITKPKKMRPLLAYGDSTNGWVYSE